MSSEQNKQTVSAIYQALNDHDLARLTPHIAEGFRLESLAFGVTVDGADSLQQFLGGFTTAFPDMTITIKRQLAADDWVVNELAWSGTHTGPLYMPSGVIPPTGKRVEQVPMCEIFTFQNDKVIRLVNYHDVATWMRQLGLI
jgi:steroid delta-isomerase-like uncharacterized protein